MHPSLERRSRAGNLVVSDDVLAVERNSVALGGAAREPRERAVQLLREERRVGGEPPSSPFGHLDAGLSALREGR